MKNVKYETTENNLFFNKLCVLFVSITQEEFPLKEVSCEIRKEMVLRYKGREIQNRLSGIKLGYCRFKNCIDN